MRTLVIGGSGPSGPLVVNGLIEAGHDVTVLNRGTRRTSYAGEVEPIVADPHFADSLEASLAGRRFDTAVVMYGRLRLMPAALRGVTDRVVSVGGTAYRPRGGRVSDEDSPRDDSNPILVKLVEAENDMARAHADGWFSHTHLRYPLLWGPGQLAPKDWSIARRAIDGRPFIPMIDGGRTIESKCYVANAAAAVVRAVQLPQEAAGRTYNVIDEVCPDDATRARDLCAALGRADIELLDLPQGMGGPAGFWRIGRSLSDTDRDVIDTEHRLVDGSRIRDELGHRDVVPYEEGVRRIARFYLDHPLPAGGPEEQKIGDPFDYGAEDEYARVLRAALREAESVEFVGVRFSHQYDHPRRP